jgi:raffinose/stachyose/melibiose transport system permease protein
VRKDGNNKALHYIFVAFCWIYAAFSLYPLIWMLFYSFKTNQEIFVTNPFGVPWPLHYENYITAWTKYDVPTYFKNSLLVSIGTVAITIFCALLFSYATSRMVWKFKTFTRLFIGLGMFIPVQAIMIPVVKIVDKFGLMGS